MVKGQLLLRNWWSDLERSTKTFNSDVIFWSCVYLSSLAFLLWPDQFHLIICVESLYQPHSTSAPPPSVCKVCLGLWIALSPTDPCQCLYTTSMYVYCHNKQRAQWVTYFRRKWRKFYGQRHVYLAPWRFPLKAYRSWGTSKFKGSKYWLSRDSGNLLFVLFVYLLLFFFFNSCGYKGWGSKKFLETGVDDVEACLIGSIFKGKWI